MPEISRFYGIVVKIFFRGEHNPPHIHASYGEYAGLIDIQSREMIEGDLPPKALELVQDWMSNYTKELQDMWDKKELQHLPPLK